MAGKDFRTTTRWTERQMRYIEQRANALCMKPSQYIRSLVNGQMYSDTQQNRKKEVDNELLSV